MEEAKLNDIIDRLLEARNGRPGKQVHLVEAEIKQLCMTAREIFMAQPNLLELEAPIKICGAAGAFSVVPPSSCRAPFNSCAALLRGTLSGNELRSQRSP